MTELLRWILGPVDRWAGRRQYAIGKEFVRREQYERAIASFEHSERWVRETMGPSHPFVAAAIMKQAWCKAKLGRSAESCTDFRRALPVMLAAAPTHPKIREVEVYLREQCEDEVAPDGLPA